MNIDIWLPPVLAAVIGALLSPSVGKGLLTLAGARARRIKHIPVDGAGLYINGVPMDQAQFRGAFAAYQAELDALPPPAERNEWQTAQQIAACQCLAVITGTHPHAFLNLGDPDQAWAWYRGNNPYAIGALPRPHTFRLLPTGNSWQTDLAALAARSQTIERDSRSSELRERVVGGMASRTFSLPSRGRQSLEVAGAGQSACAGWLRSAASDVVAALSCCTQADHLPVPVRA